MMRERAVVIIRDGLDDDYFEHDGWEVMMAVVMIRN